MVNISREIVQDDFSIVDLGGENSRLQRFSAVAAKIVILDVIGFNLDKKLISALEVKLDLRSTMSSPRTGILSLIRFNSGQN